MNRILTTVFLIMTLFLAACAAPSATTPATESSPAQASEAPADDGTVTVGVMVPLTGGAASYGLAMKKAIEMAAEESSAPITLVFEDSQCDGKEAVTAINKLISVDNVDAIIGEVCSGATLAAAPIAEENGVSMMSPSSTSPEITNAGDFIFRTVPSDALQGEFGANMVFDAGHTKLASLYSNEEYGLGFTTVLEESFAALGGEVVASESFDREAVDVRTQLTKIKAKNPDALYIIGNSPDTIVSVLKQAKELGIEAQLYGSEGLKSQDILDDSQGAGEGLILSTVSAGSADFVQKHQDKYGEEPGPFAAQAYDAYMLYAAAVEGGASTRNDIAAALPGLTLSGASGQLAFDENGDVSGNYDVYTASDGAFVPVEN